MEVDGLEAGHSGDFRLSAVLKGHSSDVRAVILPHPSLAATASRDGTVRVWKQTSSSPPLYDDIEASHGAQFKTCLCFMPSTKEYPDGLVISSGQDGLIEARQPSSTATDNADGFMVGHSNQVCSLDVNTEHGWIVSGSWDKSARIWQIGRWETEVELQGHTAAVWAVVAYDRDTVVTGCADHAIRVFDVRGKLRVSFDGKDIVRALVKLPEKHSTGAEIVSASNDGVVRLWSLKGQRLAELHGHESFIYSLTILPSGEIASSGEDRTVRIWAGTDCVQVVTLPAISIWSVSACPNGDIITGASDKIARIFTRSQERLADAAVIAEFEENVKSSSIPQQQVGAINKTDMPGPEFLESKSGTKEGQTQMIKELDGSVTAYQWSTSQQTWIKIGTVVDSASSGGNKQSYNGKEYDFVFDIDIEDGKPALKLPFNVNQNPYDAATKFLQDHELPMTYLEETANFIIKNTQGVSLGPSPSQAGLDPMGTEQRYRPGEVSTYQPRHAAKKVLPFTEYVAIVAGKPDAPYRQIAKLNSQYESGGKRHLQISNSELETLSKLAKELEAAVIENKPSAASAATLESSLPIAMRVATQWDPPQNRLAGLDMLRFVAAGAKEFPTYEVDGNDCVEVLLDSGIYDEETISTSPKLAMVATRFFANLLYGSKQGRVLFEKHYQRIVDNVKVASFTASSDASMAIAITTFFLNLAIFITSTKEVHEESTDHGLSILEALVPILASFPVVDHKVTGTELQQSTNPAYRGLIAIGTVIVGLEQEEVTMAAKDKDIFDVPGLLTQLQDRRFLQEPRFQTVAKEIRNALG